MKPYVAGEGAVLRVYRGKKKILAKSLTFKPVDGGAAGVATVKVSSKVAGSLAIKVSHKATPAVGTLRAKTLRVNIVRPYANTGSSGPAVRWLQGKLAALKYVVPRTGVYDAGTGRAVMAWRKVAGFSRTYVATSQVFDGLLKGKGRFKVRHPGDGRHVEARINSQVLALINGGKVERIYHTSIGRARDADRARQVPRLHEDAGHQRQGHGRLELLHPRLRHPRLRLGAAVQRQPRLPARAGPERAGDLRLAADRRRGLGRAVGLVREAGEHRLHPAGGVGRAHAVRAAALAQDALDLLERILAVEVARVGPGDVERVRADLGDRAHRAAPPDRRVHAVAGGAEARTP